MLSLNADFGDANIENTGSTVAEISNPTPSVTTNDIFDKVFGSVVTLGGNYLTARGQIAIAEESAKAQARLNDYHAVNPSLGPVNPAAAQVEANKTWLQKFLPGGSPLVGAPGTGQQPAIVANPWSTIVMVLGGVLVLLLIVRLVMKK